MAFEADQDIATTRSRQSVEQCRIAGDVDADLAGPATSQRRRDAKERIEVFCRAEKIVIDKNSRRRLFSATSSSRSASAGRVRTVVP